MACLAQPRWVFLARRPSTGISRYSTAVVCRLARRKVEFNPFIVAPRCVFSSEKRQTSRLAVGSPRLSLSLRGQLPLEMERPGDKDRCSLASFRFLGPRGVGGPSLFGRRSSNDAIFCSVAEKADYWRGHHHHFGRRASGHNTRTAVPASCGPPGMLRSEVRTSIMMKMSMAAARFVRSLWRMIASRPSLSLSAPRRNNAAKTLTRARERRPSCNG
jgi:hypothetical protein